MQTKPNPIDILGNIEILARMLLGKMARMVTLLQLDLSGKWKINNNTYNIIAEDILYITHPRLDLSGKLIICGCAHTCLHIYLFIYFIYLYLYSAFNNTDCVKALNSIKLEDGVSVMYNNKIKHSIFS